MKRNRFALINLGALLLTASFASAQTTLYWDTNGASAGSGNSAANWGGSNWTTDATGSSATGAWTNGSAAVFSAGTDGTGSWAVTIDAASTFTVSSLLFKEVADTRTINGGTLNIGGATINSTANGTGDPGGNNGRDVNINSVLTGTGGLTIAAHGNNIANSGGGGGSELRLGGNNTFSGGLTITSGLVSWTTDANLGDPSNVINLNGGGLLCTGTNHFTSRNIRIGASGGTIRNYGSTNLTLSGTLSNADGVASTTFRRTDGGTLIINTPGTGFAGTFINGGGSTVLTETNPDWSNTDFTLAGGNLTFNGAGGTAVIKSINSTADVILNNGTTLNVTGGAITLNTGHWYKTNFGSLGKLTTSSGTLTVTNGAATGDLTTNDHQFQIEVADYGATPVAFVKNNQNTLVLAQANTFTGGTTINGGRIESKNTAAFGTGPVTVNTGGQVLFTQGGAYSNNFTISGNGPTEGANQYGALRISGPATLAGTLNVASASRITSYNPADIGFIAGPVTGTGSIEKTGGGTLVLSGDTSGYSGGMSVNNGTLRLDTGLTNVTVGQNGTLGGEGTVSGSLVLQGSATGNAKLNVDGSTDAALTTKDLTVAYLATVNLTGYPITPGTPIDVVKYTGTLTMTGTANDNFDLAWESSYRNIPFFTDTGSAITLTIPAGADLVWRGDDPTNPTFWDANTTANWSSTLSNPDTFYAGDTVLFDDTGVSKTATLNGLFNPAKVVFNNSSSSNYIINGGGGVGFTGGTSIVKNGTGTVTFVTYSSNYTGTVTINDGILRADCFEMLGNSSGIIVNSSETGSGQLDINGMNLGNGTRNYSLTIAGAGPDGSGAINSNSTGNPYENAGLLNLTLSANATVGAAGGRYDIGRSGGTFGTITGNQFTLTKVGNGTVCLRAPASDITYVVNAGTLKFEDTNLATGPNPITVNGGTLQAYGNRVFSNPLLMGPGSTLDNDGGGSQSWTGSFNLTGTSADTVSINARNGAITLPNVVSGDSTFRLGGNNIVYLTGSQSNTYSGATRLESTGQLVLDKAGGAVAVPHDLVFAATGTRAIVSTIRDNQFGAGSALRYTGSGDNRLELKGTTQTLAGIDNTTATPGYNCIQHSEFGSPPPVDAVSDLILNVPESTGFVFNGVLRDQGGTVNLTKSGLGTQSLVGGLIDFNGPTTVNAGRLIVNSDDSWTTSVSVAAGAYYEVNITSTTETFENRHANFQLTGAGTYEKTGPGKMSMGWDGYANVAMSSGALIDIKEGQMQFDYAVRTTWTNNKSDMNIAAGATLDLWDNNNAVGVVVDALTGAGSVVRTKNVTGNITVGVDNGSGTFAGSISNASGTTQVTKSGTGTQTLSGVNTYSGNTTVNGGTLALATTGSLRFVVTNTTSNQINGTGAVTLDGAFNIETTAVTATTGTWTLVNAATLTETFGPTFTLGAGWTETANVWTKTAGDNIWTFTEATGELKLAQNNTYAKWIDGFFPGVTDPEIIGANADPDKDGLANAVEMVLGGNPATVMDATLMPTIELVTNPGGAVPNGSYMLFTFRRTDLSVASGVTSACETDADLAGTWTAAASVEGAVVLVDDDFASFVPPATATDRVRVYVPLGTNATLFGRLKVTVP